MTNDELNLRSAMINEEEACTKCKKRRRFEVSVFDQYHCLWCLACAIENQMTFNLPTEKGSSDHFGRNEKEFYHFCHENNLKYVDAYELLVDSFNRC